MKEPALIPIVGIVINTKKGGWITIVTFYNSLKPHLLFTYKTHNQQEYIKHKFIMEAQLG